MFVTKPVELSETVGGLHVYSSLHLYRLMHYHEGKVWWEEVRDYHDLLSLSSWSLSFSLRCLSVDGHVIAISSVSGVSISVMLESDGIINLRLTGEINITRIQATNTPLPINTWRNNYCKIPILNSLSPSLSPPVINRWLMMFINCQLMERS